MINMFRRGRRIVRWCLLSGMALGIVGCVTSGSSRSGAPSDPYRYAGYRPDVGDVDLSDGTGRDGESDIPVDARRLEAEDTVTILLRTQRGTLQVDDIIDERGIVDLQHVGPILLAGLTTSQAEEAIRKAYIEGKIYNQLTVTVICRRLDTKTFYVRGEVKRPGRFDLMQGTTLLQAVTTAGGVTDFGDPKRVTIKRGSNKLTRHSLPHILEDREEDPVIEAGDVITVLPKRI